MQSRIRIRARCHHAGLASRLIIPLAIDADFGMAMCMLFELEFALYLVSKRPNANTGPVQSCSACSRLSTKSILQTRVGPQKTGRRPCASPFFRGRLLLLRGKQKRTKRGGERRKAPRWPRAAASVRSEDAVMLKLASLGKGRGEGEVPRVIARDGFIFGDSQFRETRE